MILDCMFAHSDRVGTNDICMGPLYSNYLFLDSVPQKSKNKTENLVKP
jgi:hypothetical protein